MWNRQQVKEQAKQIMKRNYWKMFVVTLIASILTGEKTTIIERIQDFASNNLSYDAQPIFYSSNFQYIFYSFICYFETNMKRKKVESKCLFTPHSLFNRTKFMCY